MTQGCKQRCMCIPKVHNQLTYYEFDCTQYTMPKDSMCTPENEAYKMIKNLKAVHCSAKAFSIWKYQVYARVPEQVWCKPGFSGCAMTDEPCQGQYF
uniref:Uncharacterized protein n=1 Tax=Romanomermis culicivorax TaxID=13658 RepID=A0A915KGN7_ROMCU